MVFGVSEQVHRPKRLCHGKCVPVLEGPADFQFASSSSMRFFSGSSFEIRNERICPALMASGRAASLLLPAFAPGPPPFHLLASMEESADTSTGPDFASCLLSLSESWQYPCTPSPRSTVARLRFTSLTRPVTESPSLCSVMYSSSAVG